MSLIPQNTQFTLRAALAGPPLVSPLGRLARRFALVAALGLGSGYIVRPAAVGKEISSHAAYGSAAAFCPAESLGELDSRRGGISILVHQYDFDDSPACPPPVRWAGRMTAADSIDDLPIACPPPVHPTPSVAAAASVAAAPVPFVDHFQPLAAIRRTSRSLGRLLAAVTGAAPLRVPATAPPAPAMAEVIEVEVPEKTFTAAEVDVQPTVGFAKLNTEDVDQTLDAILSLDAWWLAAPTIAAQSDPAVAAAFGCSILEREMGKGEFLQGDATPELIPSDPAIVATGRELPSPLSRVRFLVGSGPVVATLTEAYRPYDLAKSDLMRLEYVTASQDPSAAADLSLPAEPVAPEHGDLAEVVEVPVFTAPRTVMVDVHLSPEAILADWIDRGSRVGGWFSRVGAAWDAPAAQVAAGPSLERR